MEFHKSEKIRIADGEGIAMTEVIHVHFVTKNKEYRLTNVLYLKVYVLNRKGTSSQRGKTPCKLRNGSKPEIKYLKTFSTTVYVHVPKQKRRKLDIKFQKGIFIGYDENIKAYRVYFPDTKKISVHRDVILRKKETEDFSKTSDDEDELVMLNFNITGEQKDKLIKKKRKIKKRKN